MSKVSINESTLTNIGDAIREKTGKTDLIAPGDMPDEIMAIETGGGGGDLPEEAFKLTGDCSYMFHKGKWDWFIEKYGDKITTENIDSTIYMFRSTKLEKISFDINLGSRNGMSLQNMFYQSNLKELPKLTSKITTIPTSSYNFLTITEMFSSMKYIREIPDDYLTSIVPEGYWQKRPGNGVAGACSGCYSLRKTINLIPFISYSGTSVYSSAYYNLYNNCYALDEVINLPVETGATYTSNAFSGTFDGCGRLKNMTFATQEDGTPYVVNWKGQAINLIPVGYYSGGPSSNLTKYNSGITMDKSVYSDEKYQALKDDPDWFTAYKEYSRYNHDSAVATINSLPDASAYLAANGGTNTIKFNSEAGSKTDGGAINTLTEEEIAVATAKGWTVSLV